MANPSESTRREFLKQAGIGALGASLAAPALPAQGLQDYLKAAPAADPRDVVAALGDTLIPTEEPDYPGYRRLEDYGISKEVLNALRRLSGIPRNHFNIFNAAGRDLLGKVFVELDEKQRLAYVELVLKLGEPRFVAARKLHPEVLAVLPEFLQAARTQILAVFYRNFPYHTVPRDDSGLPILTDEEHQIVNPKKSDIVTGWDIAGFRGPLRWEEEQQRRARYMKIHWHTAET